MKLCFKQRLFSWFDSYDIYGENGQTLYTVEGQPAWGHTLHILNPAGVHIATVKEVIFTFLPRFELYLGERYVGCIQKQLTLLRPQYRIDCNGWQVEGDWTGWNYRITAANGTPVAAVSKELFRLTDTYVIDVSDPKDALCALMLTLAIDAEKCSRS